MFFDSPFNSFFLSDLSPQDEEVEALKLVALDQFQWLIDNIGVDNHFVPSNKSYYQFVLDQLKTKLA